VPVAGAVDAVIAELADRAGESPDTVRRLMDVFADPARGNICIEDARCTVCQVYFCKRLRDR
jgi:hypothetical protein